MKLAVNIGGIRMKNPVMVASGTFGYGEEFSKFFDLSKLGAIVVKGTTLKPRLGNPCPRIVETDSGMINSIGLQNVGVENFIKDKLPFLRKFNTPVIVNIAGFTVDEFCELAKRLNVKGVSGLELNISCPNVKYSSKVKFSHDAKLTYQVTKRVRKNTKLPLIVKLSPDVTDITLIAKACEEAGADAVSLINTFPAMAIDTEAKKPILGNVEGGLSGPAIKPIALRLVWKVYQKIKIPIIGMGGIISAKDAIEFMIAGAKGIAVGTANFINPYSCIEILNGIKKYMHKHRMNSISKLIGSLSRGSRRGHGIRRGA